ncbi:MAG: hypothetical protein IID45_02780, partial [Planctomycetes bacterium]|nr:hypothetical protein [Planctomycetota bacterium]
MSRELETRPALARFFESFFQERNIKWMLGIGMAILLGSSLMLVTSHWDEYPPFWKFALLMGYTAAVFFSGEVCFSRLGLRRTGSVLSSLTVLLLPITFLALRWIQPGDSLFEWAGQVGLLSLLAVNFAGACYAANRIFTRFLRRSQPTFVAAYLMLCLGGVLLPTLPPGGWRMAVTAVLWAVFTVGTIKVNRHVFWLTEEHRLPRVFGFFPIALLGAQFVTMFALNLAPHIPLDWMGLACTLVAVPILLTADAVQRVFRLRTGDIVRPLPWNLVLPMIVGLGLCATGVALAATGWPRPFALVPTAALAAAMMAVTAHRSRQTGFVWAMLGGTMLAYNFLPVFFLEIAEFALQSGANAVHESRLPFAFYGLTYLPLLAGLMFFARWTSRRGNELFSRPIRRFAVGLSAVLFLASFGHVKAVFPVGLVMTAIFTTQAFLFRDRRLLAGGAAAWIAAAAGVTPFLTGVLEMPVPRDIMFLSLGVAAAVLLGPGRWLDRRGRSLPQRTNSPQIESVLTRVCGFSSLAVTLVAAAVWLVWFGLHGSGASCWVSGTLLAVLLTAHALVWLRPGLGEAALVFAGLAGLIAAFRSEISAVAINTVATLILLLLWLLVPALGRFAHARGARAFRRPFDLVSLVGLTILLAFNSLNQFVFVDGGRGHVPIAWAASLLVLIWSFDAARRVSHWLPSAMGCFGVLSFVSSGWMTIAATESALSWLPAVWAATAFTAVPINAWLSRTPNRAVEALRQPIGYVIPVLLTFVAVVSLLIFTAPMRVAGGIGATGLLLFGLMHQDRAVKRFALLLANLQVIAAVVYWFLPEEGSSILSLTWSDFVPCALPMAALAATSLLLPTLSRRETEPKAAQLRLAHYGVLACLAGLGLLMSLPLLATGLTPIDVLLAAVAFGTIAGFELYEACRTHSESRVWLAEALAVIAAGYFVLFGVISPARGISMYLMLASGVLLWIVGQASAR